VQQLDPGYRETIDAYQTAWEAGKLDGYYTVTVFGWPRDEKINTIYVTGPYATYERARTDAIWFEQSREGSVVAWEVVGGPRKLGFGEDTQPLPQNSPPEMGLASFHVDIEPPPGLHSSEYTPVPPPKSREFYMCLNGST
jgi:hypothetical protein